MQICLDEYGHETYASFEEFCDHCGELAALDFIRDTATLDASVECAGISTSLLTDLHATIGNESIKDKVANMASKAKSNIVLWAKKFINFFFGWIINFFKGVVNIRKSLKAGYDKSNTYLKELDKLSGKLGSNGSNKDGSAKTIQITDSAKFIITCLTTVLLTSHVMKSMEGAFSYVLSQTKNAGPEMFIKIGIPTLTSFLVLLSTAIATMDPQEGNFYSSLKARDYSIKNWFDEIFTNEGQRSEIYKSLTAVANDEAITVTAKFVGYLMRKMGFEDLLKQVDEKTNNPIAEAVKNAGPEIKKVLVERSKNMEALEPKEVELQKAYSIIKEGLLAFQQISSKNKELWNFEKNVASMEKIRRTLIQHVDKLVSDVKTNKEGNESDQTENAVNEKALESTMADIIAVGNLFSDASKSANKMMSLANKCIDTLMTDTKKLGSALISIGDSN